MKIIRNDCTDPCFNLAAEEYLMSLAARTPEFSGLFMLWRNGPSVIIGRSQNAYAEIDRAFTDAHGIAVVRRLTGGGAVFHDLGNVNYTYIVRDDGSGIDFSRWTAPVIRALASMGVDAVLTGRNDLACGGAKISGSAQCHQNGVLLHHGTLLFSADLSAMSGALTVNAAKLASKGVKSVRSRVANIRDLCGSSLDAAGFLSYLEKYAEREYGMSAEPFDAAERAAIEELARNKYRRWEWNWGESKHFQTSAQKYFPYGLVEVDYSLSGGYISEFAFSGDFFGVKPVTELSGRLAGLRFDRQTVEAALSDVSDYISGASPEDIAGLLF